MFVELKHCFSELDLALCCAHCIIFLFNGLYRMASERSLISIFSLQKKFDIFSRWSHEWLTSVTMSTTAVPEIAVTSPTGNGAAGEASSLSSTSPTPSALAVPTASTTSTTMTSARPMESPLPSPATETGPFLTFAEFRKMDENPRKFRHFMSLLAKQEAKLKKEGRIKSLTKDALRGKRERETSKLKSKDLFEQMDQQFNLSLQPSSNGSQLSTSVPTSSSSSSLSTNNATPITTASSSSTITTEQALSRRHSIASEKDRGTPKGGLTKSLKPFKSPKQRDERKKTRGGNSSFHLYFCWSLNWCIYQSFVSFVAIGNLRSKCTACGEHHQWFVHKGVCP